MGGLGNELKMDLACEKTSLYLETLILLWTIGLYSSDKLQGSCVLALFGEIFLSEKQSMIFLSNVKGGDSVKVRVGLLIFIIVFATVATSLILGFSTSQISERNVDFAKFYDIVQIDNEEGVEPDGKPKDGPPMPG